MAKRSATSELNHDNWNDEEEPEDAGCFQQASTEVLQKRVIRQARRKLGANTGEEKPNVFAGFSGFGASTPKPTASLFSFLGQKPATATETEKKTENGSSKPTATDENGNEAEYLANLRVLNEAVTSWVSEHVKKNPCCVLTPIFQDYEKHLKGLEDKRKGKKNELPSTTPTEKETPSKDSAVAKFSFGKALETSSITIATPGKADAIKPEPPKFEIGKVQTTAAPTLTLFGSSTSSSLSTSSSTFSFGSSTGTAPFTFGSSTTTTPAAPFSFGFGSMNKPLPPVAEKKEEKEDEDKEGNEDEDETPPKAEIKKVEEDDAFYSIRCKLFYKKGNSYAEKGVGTLFLKKAGDEKTQLVVRAETSLGNILLNIFLNPQLSTQRVGKNNVMLVCVPNPPIDPKSPAVPTPMLFRVKTEEEADELLQKLNDAKK